MNCLIAFACAFHTYPIFKQQASLDCARIVIRFGVLKTWLGARFFLIVYFTMCECNRDTCKSQSANVYVCLSLNANDSKVLGDKWMCVYLNGENACAKGATEALNSYLSYPFAATISVNWQKWRLLCHACVCAFIFDGRSFGHSFSFELRNYTCRFNSKVFGLIIIHNNSLGHLQCPIAHFWWQTSQFIIDLVGTFNFSHAT